MPTIPRRRPPVGTYRLHHDVSVNFQLHQLCWTPRWQRPSWHIRTSLWNGPS